MKLNDQLAAESRVPSIPDCITSKRPKRPKLDIVWSAMSISSLDEKRSMKYSPHNDYNLNVVLKHDRRLVGLRHMRPSAWNGVTIAMKWQVPCLDEKSKTQAGRTDIGSAAASKGQMTRAA